MRLLLVEDEEVLGRYTSQELLRTGLSIDWVRNAQDAREALAALTYDVVLLDLGLPDASGEAVLNELRAQRKPTAVVVITARGHTEDRVALLDMGADDYIVKPYDMSELLARVRAVQRRSVGAVDQVDRQQVGPLELYRSGRSAVWFGVPVNLTTREYQVLEMLVMRRPGVVTREKLHEALFGWSEDIQSNSIEVYIHLLRRKFSKNLIITIRGRGYQIGSAELLAAEGAELKAAGRKW